MTDFSPLEDLNVALSNERNGATYEYGWALRHINNVIGVLEGKGSNLSYEEKMSIDIRFFNNGDLSRLLDSIENYEAKLRQLRSETDEKILFIMRCLQIQELEELTGLLTYEDQEFTEALRSRREKVDSDLNVMRESVRSAVAVLRAAAAQAVEHLTVARRGW